MSDESAQLATPIDPQTVVANCPIPLIYTSDEFPKLTQIQLVVLNLLEQPDLMQKQEFSERLGWHPSRISQVASQTAVVEARRTLWTGRGNSLSKHIPDIVKERVEHAKGRDKGCIGSSRLVLETAGVIGVNTVGVVVNLKAEELNLSFTQSINVMAQANELRDVTEAE